VTKLTSTAAELAWDRLSCREHNGIAVGYMYQVSRYRQPTGSVVDIMYGILNGTVLELSGLVPFTNYTVNVRFANRMHEGPRSTLDFVTFEDCKCLMSV